MREGTLRRLTSLLKANWEGLNPKAKNEFCDCLLISCRNSGFGRVGLFRARNETKDDFIKLKLFNLAIGVVKKTN